MPLVRIAVPQHYTNAKAVLVADVVHESLVLTCDVPEDDRFQMITRFPEDFLIIHPTFGGVNRSSDCFIAQICYLSGRTDSQKRALYATLAKKAEAIGIRPDDVFVEITENHLIDWSVGAGKAYAPPGTSPS